MTHSVPKRWSCGLIITVLAAIDNTAISTSALPHPSLPSTRWNPRSKSRMPAPQSAAATPSVRTHEKGSRCIPTAISSVKTGPSVARIDASTGLV